MICIVSLKKLISLRSNTTSNYLNMKKTQVVCSPKKTSTIIEKSISFNGVFKLLLIVIIFSAIEINGSLIPLRAMNYNEQNINAQEDNSIRSISGTVVDENGESMIGVSILVKGTKIGTTTDLNGKFNIKLNTKNSTLAISYVGYISQEIDVKSGQQIKVELKPTTKELEQVVVIGYGVQKKSNVTGAISSVNSKDLANSSITNVATALQGKVSGVNVINSSGAPGSSSGIQIRGYSSNGKSDPLYIVDGLKVKDIDFLEPENIKSVEILKDGASAAIYGAEAGNGVVLITTKTGTQGEGKLFFNVQKTYESISRKLDLMNANEYTNFYLEAYPTRKDEFDFFYFNDPSSNIRGKLVDTDWQNEIFSKGLRERYTVGFQGGNDKGALYVSMSYLNHDGIVITDNDKFTRVTGQLNANYNIKKWLEVGLTNSIESSNSKKIAENSTLYGVTTMGAIGSMDPLTPVEYDNGLQGSSLFVQNAVADGYSPLINQLTGNYYGASSFTSLLNPIATLNREKEYTKSFRVNGTAYLNIKPIKNLVYTSRLGYRFLNNYYNRYIPKNWLSMTSSANNIYLESIMAGNMYYQWENFANYSFDIKKHNFSILGGMSFINSETNIINVNTNELSNNSDNFHYLDYSTETAIDKVLGNTTNQAQIAYYGRFSWSYDNKYNLQVNFRADSYDAAYLDLANNWGYFPSISAGWTITNEKFMSNVNQNTLSFAKMRFSLGRNGSINNLQPYMYGSTMKSGGSGFMNVIPYKYYMNGQLYTGVYPYDFLANPKLRWEESDQLNVGLDLRFLKGKLSLTADYFNKNTNGLLVQTTSNLTTGTSYVWKNLGMVNNHGLELDLGYQDQINNDFKYNIKANISFVSNKVTEYLKDTRIQGTGTTMSYFEEGYPIWYLRAYKVEGIDQETGRAIYKDVDLNGTINENDKVYAGSGLPDFTYGTTINLEYKNFNLNIYGTGVHGVERYYGQTNEKLQNRLQGFYDNRWTADNKSAFRPSAFYQTEDPLYAQSDQLIFDASFFKIKQIQLGYSVPQKYIKNFWISELKIYATMDNYFTFTKYPGLDPESRSSTDASTMAIDYGGYPIPKSITFGLNITL